MKVPCIKCTKRRVGCHAECEVYQAFREKRRKEREARQKMDSEAHDYNAVRKRGH